MFSSELLRCSAGNLPRIYEFQITPLTQSILINRASHPPRSLIGFGRSSALPGPSSVDPWSPCRPQKSPSRCNSCHWVAFIYSCRWLGKHFRFLLHLMFYAGQGRLSHKQDWMLVAAQYQTLENDALWLVFGLWGPLIQLLKFGFRTEMISYCTVLMYPFFHKLGQQVRQTGDHPASELVHITSTHEELHCSMIYGFMSGRRTYKRHFPSSLLLVVYARTFVASGDRWLIPSLLSVGGCIHQGNYEMNPSKKSAL